MPRRKPAAPTLTITKVPGAMPLYRFACAHGEARLPSGGDPAWAESQVLATHARLVGCGCRSAFVAYWEPARMA